MGRIVHVRDEESSLNTLLTENVKQLGSVSTPSSAITHCRKPKPHSQPRSIIKSQRNLPSIVARVDIHSIGNIPHPRRSHSRRCKRCRSLPPYAGKWNIPRATPAAAAVAPLAASPTMRARMTAVAMLRAAVSI